MINFVVYMNNRRTSNVSAGERWSDASNWDWIMNLASDSEIPPLGMLELPRPSAPQHLAPPLAVNNSVRPPGPLPQAQPDQEPLPWVRMISYH